jgi:O-antigen/teichoic acid export membrane protein
VLGFSRERVEDELIRQLRWKALAHATWINALLFLAATLTVYGATYLYVMYAQLVAFLVLFNVLLAWSLRTHYASGHEE